MQIHTFFRGGYASNSYFLVTDSEACIIDPSIGYDDVLRYLGGNMPNVKYIILTHAHFDHMLDISDWKEKTGATVIVGKDCAAALSDPYLNLFRPFLRKNEGYFGDYQTVSDGDELTLSGENFKFIETPGHQAGAIAILSGKYCFVGDTVFAYGGVGRTDLPGSDHTDLIRSIKKIAALPEDTVIYPGHGEPTYARYLKNLNIYGI